MDHEKVCDYWNKNADLWQQTSDNGFDVWRDYLNTPAFMDMLPDMSTLSGIEIGYGDGNNSRLFADRCKSLTAIDISDRFLVLNQKYDNPLNLSFKQMNAAKMSFPNGHFDFALSTMAFMDIASLDEVLAEINRVLAPNGFLQFSILHPCFHKHKGRWVMDDDKPVGFLMKDYFLETDGDIDEWQHKKAPSESGNFAVPRFWRPLNKWLNALVNAGFCIEEIAEPCASDDLLKKVPELATTRVVAHSLIVRCRKTSGHRQPLKQVVEKLPGNVWWKDKNLVYLGCNDRVIEVLGTTRQDFIGKTDHQLWSKEIADKLEKADRRIIKKGESLSIEEVIVEADGRHAVMLTNKSPLYDENNNIIGVLGTSTDITKRKEDEAELRKAKEMAEIANRAKTDFIQNMEHDIRTPFGGIWSLTNLLLEMEDDPEKKDILEDISLCAKALLDYSNSILDFSKTEAGLTPLIARKFDLPSLIQRVVNIERPPARQRKIKLFSEIDEKLPKIVIGDVKRLERILISLVSNGVKFTKHGYVKVAVKLVKKDADRRIILSFVVEDTGIGISKDMQTMIYEKFTRGTPANRGVYKGSGLGLHLVKQLVEELDGEVDVKSEAGKGSTFICTMPFKIPLVEDVIGI